MNVLIHLAAGLGIAVAITDTTKKTTKPKTVVIAATGLFISIASHGLLDYAPHCYPVNAKVDFSLGILMICLLTYFSSKRYRPIIIACLIGAVLPDIIDLLPAILNKQLHLHLPVYRKIFPWHWKQFSGSIYSGSCFVSNINIALALLSVLGILVVRSSDLKIYIANAKSLVNNPSDFAGTQIIAK